MDTMLPKDTFKDAVVLVTGGGTGLGLAMSLAFASLGAGVVVASRNPAHRERGLELIRELGGPAAGVELEVREAASVAAAFDAAEAALGPVRVLVNNAAANFFAKAEDITANGWDTVVDRVLKGGFLCSREFAARRIATGQPGAILNIVSAPGFMGGPGVAHSAAAKAGMINLTRTLAVEWAPHDIRVNAIAPGTFLHDDGDPAVRAGRLHWEDAHRRIPLGRTGELQELGWLATYLCSTYAGFMTGQVIALDGGGHLPRTVAQPEFTPIAEQLRRADAAAS